MRILSANACMLNARRAGTVIPAFNIPYLPMMAPIVAALRDTEAFGLITVARLEWIKFESRSPRAIYEEYQRVKDERFTRLHLDHVPAIDEDDMRVDYEAVIREAIELGYESVMVDGSRLSLEDNIQATRQVAELAHAAGVPVEGIGVLMAVDTIPDMFRTSANVVGWLTIGTILGRSSEPMPTGSADLQ